MQVLNISPLLKELILKTIDSYWIAKKVHFPNSVFIRPEADFNFMNRTGNVCPITLHLPKDITTTTLIQTFLYA